MKNGETVRRILRREKRRLPVKLEQHEMLDRARQVATLDGEIDLLTQQAEKLKQEVKSLSAEGDVKMTQLRDLARVLRLGQEEREVPISIEVDRTGTVREVRVDTGEVVRERPLTAQEAQETLDFGPEPEPVQREIDITPPALPPAEEEEEEEEERDG